jgi:hypothetical protein
MQVSSVQVLAGESVTVSGNVQCPEGVEAAGQTVTLLVHTPRGPRGLSEAASATSAADGSYQISSPALEENTNLVVQVGTRRSARRRVRVAPQISVLAPASGTELLPASRADAQAATNTVTFEGTVTPAAPADLVVLQRELPEGSGRWRRVAVSRLDEAGRYTITHTFRRPGTVTVRVLVRCAGALLPTVSEALTYTVVARARAPRVARAHRSHRS